MDQESSPEQVTDGKTDPFSGRNALILNQGSFSCPANQCGSLLSSLQKHISFREILERNATVSLREISFIPDLVFLRLSLDASAQQLIESCKRTWNRVAMIALFCRGSNELIDNFPSPFAALDDFVYCPFRQNELIQRVKRLLQSKEKKAISPKQLGANEPLHFGALVGESESFVRAIKNIPPLAQSDATVLICGETGTGKELFARAIHYHSPRRNKPFIPVNCAALPDHLFENELFGHVKGAFTDANSSEKGLIAEAEGGSLILDEVDTLSPAAQAKLLRFMQNGEYRPLGSSRSVTGNVRIVAATNAHLFDQVKAKLFREDLYYRLNALSVIIPPLRERIEDIVHLSNHFLTQYARERIQEQRGISRAALRKLMAYAWPGNVRELEGVILRALTLTASATLQPADINLPQQFLNPTPANSLLRQAKTNMIYKFEVGYLTNLLTVHHGNITHAAKAAGKQRRTLQRLLRKYSLNPQSFRI